MNNSCSGLCAPQKQLPRTSQLLFVCVWYHSVGCKSCNYTWCLPALGCSKQFIEFQESRICASSLIFYLSVLQVFPFIYSYHRVCFIRRGLQQDLLSVLENVKGTTKVGHLHIQSGSICLKCHNTPLLFD